MRKGRDEDAIALQHCRSATMTFQGFTGSGAFQFVGNINLRFGGGTAQTLPAELKALGVRKPFVMIDPGVHQAGVAAPILKALEGAGVAATVFTEIEPNPRDDTIHRAFDVAKASGCNGIVGIGGGSAMDSAKGVGLLMTNGGAIAEGRLATFKIGGLSLSRAILYIRHRDKYIGEALRAFESAARGYAGGTGT
jgi:hypothetical protein